MWRLNQLLIMASLWGVCPAWSMELRPVQAGLVENGVFANLQPSVVVLAQAAILSLERENPAFLDVFTPYDSIVMGASLRSLWVRAGPEILIPMESEYGYSEILKTLSSYLKKFPRLRDGAVTGRPIAPMVELTYRPARKRTPVNC